MKALSDLPISSIDEDLLNRQPFVDRIVEVISHRDKNHGQTIGIVGAWGTGKTSIANLFIDQYVKKNKDSIVVSFCPWHYSSYDDLVRRFFASISQTIRLNNPDIKVFNSRRAQLFSDVADLFAQYAEALSPLVPIAPATGLIKSTLNLIGSRQRARSLDIVYLRSKLIEAVLELDESIVVLMDDIDRLTPQQMSEIVKLVKSVGDIPGFCYIICMDDKIVQRTVCDFLGIEDEKARRAFLDKIFSLIIPLPKTFSFVGPSFICEKILEIADLKLNLIDEDRKLIEACIKTVEMIYFNNIRQIKRIATLLSLYYPMVKDEIEVSDLFIFCVISELDHSVYDMISYRPYLFVRDPPLRYFEKTVMMKRSDIDNKRKSEVKEWNFPCPNLIDLAFNADSMNIVDIKSFNKIYYWRPLRVILSLFSPDDIISNSDIAAALKSELEFKKKYKYFRENASGRDFLVSCVHFIVSRGPYINQVEINDLIANFITFMRNVWNGTLNEKVYIYSEHLEESTQILSEIVDSIFYLRAKEVLREQLLIKHINGWIESKDDLHIVIEILYRCFFEEGLFAKPARRFNDPPTISRDSLLKISNRANTILLDQLRTDLNRAYFCSTLPIWFSISVNKDEIQKILINKLPDIFKNVDEIDKFCFLCFGRRNMVDRNAMSEVINLDVLNHLINDRMAHATWENLPKRLHDAYDHMREILFEIPRKSD